MPEGEFIPINDGLLSPQIIRIRKYDDRYKVEVYTKSYDFEVDELRLRTALTALDFPKKK